MSTDIRIKKGLDIKLKGKAKLERAVATRSKFFTIYPDDFHAIKPKLVAREGDKVLAGDALFYNKDYQAMQFVSPVSGEIKEIKRGEKRKILEIVIQVDSQDTHKDFGVKTPSNLAEPQVKQSLLESGCWSFIKQRPYDIIANPDKAPKAIFISGFNSNPNGTNIPFSLQGKEKEFQAGIDALTKLTSGKVHLSVNEKSFLTNVNDVELHHISGPHPAGNVGTQINKIDPVNKSEVVWTVNALDVAIIGELFLTGKYNPTRTVAVAGSKVGKAQYFDVKIGNAMQEIVADASIDLNESRVISGNVFTGLNVGENGSFRHFSYSISAIPEGNYYELFGWAKPVIGNKKYSITRALTFTWLNPNQEFDLDTNMNGEHRAFVVTGFYEKVFPMDILPLQ
ncbi:MAG TPA: Na(+)-translocating NADH-quinone reductase subunit A, partial [Flavobacteriia bacterium]|nr:Na(+)-translocating NADH-quinone reductase subunit A [Flavobacteriia bacterium]